MTPRWRTRFTGATVGFPQWSPDAPDQLYFISDDSGTSQAWGLHLRTGERHRLTDQAVGVEALVVLPDGSGIVWWCDDSGDENGAWRVTSADGAHSGDLLPALPAGWSQGLALASGPRGRVTAVALADDASYSVHVAHDAGPARLVWQSSSPAGIGRQWETAPGGLSTDGTLLCLWHSERGDSLHHALRVLHVGAGVDDEVGDDVGREVGELFDDGLTLTVASWSPVPGDQRLAFLHERDGVVRPGIWDLASGERRDLPVDLPGPVDVAGWWPDADSLLLRHEQHGHGSLHRLDLATGDLTPVHDPVGWISGAGVRADGRVWLREESATRAPVVRTVDGEPVLAPLGPPPPPGRPHTSLLVDGDGGSLHVLLATPDGPPPYPGVVMVHGGPEWAYPDDLDAWEQALLDEGYAVVKPNYRGSTGGTVAWRTALHEGNIGLPEVADVVAAVDHLVGVGVLDPARVAVEGWSWGGYVALLAAGLHPDRWAAVIGGIPVCDSVMTHEDCSPPQQAYDIAIMGGSPTELPERYAERSPITHVDRVAAPVLLIAGEFDSACPIRQVRHYAAVLAARGGDVTTHVYEAGHHANDVNEKLRHADLELAFLGQHLASADG